MGFAYHQRVCIVNQGLGMHLGANAQPFCQILGICHGSRQAHEANTPLGVRADVAHPRHDNLQNWPSAEISAPNQYYRMNVFRIRCIQYAEQQI